MKKGTQTSDKKTFTINEKKKNLGLLKKVRKQERLSLETRHEHSISVPDSTSLSHCLQTRLELHSNCSDTDPQHAGTSLNRETFKRHFVN